MKDYMKKSSLYVYFYLWFVIFIIVFFIFYKGDAL